MGRRSLRLTAKGGGASGPRFPVARAGACRVTKTVPVAFDLGWNNHPRSVRCKYGDVECICDSGAVDKDEVQALIYPPGFDRTPAESPFMKFVASEFRQRGTARRLELAQKIISHPFVAGLGMRVPQRHAVLDDIESFHDADLPDRFVLKVANGWSARGVMLLERNGADEYFDHMNLQVHTADSIVALQRAAALSFRNESPQWIVEEFVKPLLSSGAIPFDYKFYCFQGEVGLIVQIDRNCSPTKVILFDGEFRALKRGTDYLLRGTAKHGTPVIPLHAPEMLWWAQKLSLEADSPFVRVDMLDSPTGPVFGEFTYSPGGTHKRTYVFSHKMIDRFDRLMTAPGRPADQLSRTGLDVRMSLSHPDPAYFNSWAGFAYNRGVKGADRLHVFYKKQARACSPDDPGLGWYRRLSALWAGVRDRLSQPKSSTGDGGAAPAATEAPRPELEAVPVP